MRIVPGSSAWLTTALVLVTTVGASLVAAVLAVARQPSWGTVILALAVVLVTQAFIENVISVHAAGVAISWSSVGLFVLGLLLLVGLALALAVTLSRASWRETTQECITTLRSAAATREKPRVYNPRMLDGLPDPVIRYFKRTLVPNCPMVKCATLNQHGEFRTVAIEGNRDNPWQPFEGVEFFTASPPGFVWDAQIRMAPLLDVQVRDGYIEDSGRMQVKLNSIITIVNATTSAELNAGALMRYLAEAVWFPTALLPVNGVRWSPIDAHRALATLKTSDSLAVSLEFRFAEDSGDVIGVYAPERYFESDGKYVALPWIGHFSHHGERGGMRIPLRGQVAWVMADGEQAYWRGHIDEVVYETSEA